MEATLFGSVTALYVVSLMIEAASAYAPNLLGGSLGL